MIGDAAHAGFTQVSSWYIVALIPLFHLFSASVFAALPLIGLEYPRQQRPVEPRKKFMRGASQ
jgi:hypothetical protein